MRGKIIGQAIEVHGAWVPGLLKSAFKEYLCYKFCKTGFNELKEKAESLVFEEVKLQSEYRIGLFVENKIFVELKSCKALNVVHLSQKLTYLKQENYPVGTLRNFNFIKLKDGRKRIINQS